MLPRLLPKNIPSTLYFLLSLTFILSFLLTMWMIFYSPVYTDEVFWKLIIARLESDQGKLVYLFAQCRDGQWIEAPLTWYPAMFVSSWFYEDASHPWILRLHGWLSFLLLLGLWSYLLKNKAGLGLTNAFLSVSAFMSVGVLPYLMVYARPEQPLLLLISITLLVTLFKTSTNRLNGLTSLFVTLGFALVTTLLSALHPKGMFLFPILLVLAWRQLKSWPWMIGLLLIMSWAAHDTLQVWQLRTTCPEFPGLMKALQALTLRPGDLLSDPLGFIQKGLSNTANFGAYVSSIEIQNQYISNWLPAGSIGWIGAKTLSIANALFWTPILIAVVVITSNWIYGRRPQGPIDLMLWISVLVAFTSIIVLQTQKNFYEVSLIWPLVLLLTIFSFGRPVSIHSHNSVRIVISILMAVALISSVLRVERFGSVSLEWHQNRLQEVASVDRQNQDLRDFARNQCNIESNAQRLVLDQKTYQAFWKHEQPIFLDYAAGWWAGESDVRETYRIRKVQGLVALCKNVPEADRSMAIEYNDYCCLSEKALR